MTDIRIKRVYEDPSSHDGCRLLVDGVWPRGLKKERVQADLWLKEVAPSSELRRWFGHDPHKWPTFRSRYFAELDAQPEAIDRLRERADRERVTLLFSARDTEHNQAVALKDYLNGQREDEPRDDRS